VHTHCLPALLALLAMPIAFAQSPGTNTTPAPARPQSEQATSSAPTALFVKFRVKPGKNAAFEAAFREMQRNMREKEPGNLYYDLCVTVEDPQLYVIMERYQNPAAVTAHNQTEHIRKVLADIRDLLDGPIEPQRLIFVSAR
jgi:quinol monooxygenase YgiN